MDWVWLGFGFGFGLLVKQAAVQHTQQISKQGGGREGGCLCCGFDVQTLGFGKLAAYGSNNGKHGGGGACALVLAWVRIGFEVAVGVGFGLLLKQAAVLRATATMVSRGEGPLVQCVVSIRACCCKHAEERGLLVGVTASRTASHEACPVSGTYRRLALICRPWASGSWLRTTATTVSMGARGGGCLCCWFDVQTLGFGKLAAYNSNNGEHGGGGGGRRGLGMPAGFGC